MSADARGEYTRGLRALADLLDTHTDIPLPYDVDTAGQGLTWIYCGEDVAGMMAKFRRAVSGTFTKGAPGSGQNFEINGRLHGLKVRFITNRDSVCTRVVTGTREVTDQIRDPDLLADVPLITVTRTVEDIEWICPPLLDAVSS